MLHTGPLIENYQLVSVENNQKNYSKLLRTVLLIEERFLSTLLISERDLCILMYRRKQSYRGVAYLDK